MKLLQPSESPFGIEWLHANACVSGSEKVAIHSRETHAVHNWCRLFAPCLVARFTCLFAPCTFGQASHARKRQPFLNTLRSRIVVLVLFMARAWW